MNNATAFSHVSGHGNLDRISKENKSKLFQL